MLSWRNGLTKHTGAVEQVGDALFVAGGNDVVVYDLSKVRPDTPSKDPPVQVGRCGAACAKILGGSASRANAHGMAYRFDVSEQSHNLVLTAAYANRVGKPSPPLHSSQDCYVVHYLALTGFAIHYALVSESSSPDVDGNS